MPEARAAWMSRKSSPTDQQAAVDSSSTSAARSGAVSARVPSKSNSTALGVTQAAQEVVDVAIGSEAILPGDRAVGHADQLVWPQAAVPAPACELRGLHEAQVIVGAFREQLQDVLGADHGEEVRLGIAVDGREKYLPAGPHQLRTRGDHARRLDRKSTR